MMRFSLSVSAWTLALTLCAHAQSAPTPTAPSTPDAVCTRRSDYRWDALTDDEVRDLYPVGLRPGLPHVPLAPTPEGIELRKGLVSFDIHGSRIHTGETKTDPLLRAYVTHDRDKPDLSPIFPFVLARQNYVPDSKDTWKPVSVANVMADVLSSSGVSTRMKRALLQRAWDANLAGHLEDLGMPIEAAEVRRLLQRAPRVDALTEDQLRSMGAHWDSSTAPGELADKAVSYQQVADGPEKGIGRSWSIAWQAELKQLSPEARNTVLMRLVPGISQPPTSRISGIYEQQLMGSNYYFESLAAYEWRPEDQTPWRWHYALVVDLADLFGIQFADRQLERVWVVAGNVDREVHHARSSSGAP